MENKLSLDKFEKLEHFYFQYLDKNKINYIKICTDESDKDFNGKLNKIADFVANKIIENLKNNQI